MRRRCVRNEGFTLVEIMIVVAIIGILAGISMPAFIRSRRRARLTKIQSNLRVFAEAFYMYNLEYGAYPPDTHIVLPPVMDEYIDLDDWEGDALGGTFNWEGPSWGEGGSYPYAGIAFFESTAKVEIFLELDEMMDDGDLSTGQFRLTSNGRYTFIIEE